MTFGQAMEHSYSQLKLMERAAARYQASISGSRFEGTMAAVAPFWASGQAGKKLTDKFINNLSKALEN